MNVLDDRFQDDILAMEDDQPSRGSVAQLLTDLPENSAERRGVLEARLKSLKDRIEATCGGTGSFGGHFNNYLKRQFDRTPELLDKVLAWFPEDGLSVEYSRRGDGTDFRPIAQASAGQRAAAMLAFLLAHGEEPLVLDQPEDDLDNHLIYDLVVRQIRENKLRRQIIVVTHNPNVVGERRCRDVARPRLSGWAMHGGALRLSTGGSHPGGSLPGDGGRPRGV